MKISLFLLAAVLLIFYYCIFIIPAEEVTGHFSQGLEGPYLIPCDIPEIWKVEVGKSFIARYVVMTKYSGEMVFVKVKGYKKPSDKQKYPYYDGIFKVTKLLEMRKATGYDCGNKAYLAKNLFSPETANDKRPPQND